VSREQLIEYLRAHPGSTAGDVASALGLKRTSVSTRLAQLAKAGELTKAERGYAAP
jgi:DNA-binding IclR family transcriptional regulator